MNSFPNFFFFLKKIPIQSGRALRLIEEVKEILLMERTFFYFETTEIFIHGIVSQGNHNI